MTNPWGAEDLSAERAVLLTLSVQAQDAASIARNTGAWRFARTSRVNTENTNPVIVAIKAGKHRFIAFREESGPTWIVYGHHAKVGQKRDKTGDRAVDATKKARDLP